MHESELRRDGAMRDEEDGEDRWRDGRDERMNERMEGCRDAREM